MTQNNPSEVRESTLSFRYEDQVYENAPDYPVICRSLGITPRWEHPFWIYDAIRSQPRLVGESIESGGNAMKRIAGEFMRRGLRRVLFSGVGASYTLAGSAAMLLGRAAGIETAYIQSSEALVNAAPYDYTDTLVVGLSASGNTQEVVGHVRQAKAAGALTAGLVNLDNTRLTALADLAWVAPGGYGLIWDYTTRLAGIAVLASELARQRGAVSSEVQALDGELRRLPEVMEAALNAIDGRCRKIGEELNQARAAAILATGAMMPVAGEMALRFMEMAHFPAFNYPAVEFLHGGIGYLAGDIPLIVPVAEGPGKEPLVRAVRVAQTLKTPSIVIAEEGENEAAPLADWVIRLPRVHPLLQTFVYLLTSQLIPYYTEVARPGGNPDIHRTDQPRYARAFDVAYPPKSH